MIKDILDQAIRLQDKSKGICVVYVKPRNKNKVIEYDAISSTFDIIEDRLIFDFWDIEGFEVKLDKIKDVKIERFDDYMTIAYVILKNGNTILIHLMN